MSASHALYGLAPAQAEKAWREPTLHGQFRHSVMQEPASAAGAGAGADAGAGAGAAASGLLFSSQ